MRRLFTERRLLILILLTTSIGILLHIYNNSSGGDFFSGLFTFKFFTLQSNFLLLLFAGLLLLIGDGDKQRFLKRFTGPLTSYIFVTGLVYLIILEPIYDLYGPERVSSIILHYITPLLTLIYWLLWEENRYKYSFVAKWLVYPVLFMIWGVFRAIVYKDYLYPFFDLEKYGIYITAYIAAVALFFSIIILGVIFINRKYLVKGKF